MLIEQIKEHLEKWLEADLAVTRGKSYTIDGLTYTRQDAAVIRDQIEYWEKRLRYAMGKRAISVRYARPLDGITFPWGRGCR